MFGTGLTRAVVLSVITRVENAIRAHGAGEARLVFEPFRQRADHGVSVGFGLTAA